MKMKKPLLLILSLALLTLLSLVASQGSNDQVVTITWWGTERGRDTAATRELHFTLARAFEASHPNIKVALSLFPSRGFNARVATAIAGGQGPDVWYHTLAADAAQQGFLEDLTPFIEASGIDPQERWFPIGNLRAQFDGRIYGVPRDAVAGFIAYNKDLFEAAGVELPKPGWTVADFREIAKALTDNDKDQFGVGAIAGGDGCLLWSPFSFNLGTDLVSPDGHSVEGYLDTPAAADAFRYCLELVTDDQVTAPAELQDQYGELVFLSGNVGMQSISNWELPAIKEQADFQWGVIEPPRFSEDAPGTSWTDSTIYSIWSGSKHKEAAWELVEWLTGPEGQRIQAESGIWPSSMPSIWEEVGADKDPITSVSFAELQKETVVPNYLRSQFFFDCAFSAFSNARVRWIENGERDLAAILAEETPVAQACLDDSYGSTQ